MALPQFHDLRSNTRRSLSAATDPKKVILLHAGVTLLVSLLLILVDFLLEQQIGSTGGLSGIGARSVLETARSVLQLVRNIALPFWQAGYLYYTILVAQGKDAAYSDLLQGFRRFGAVLRLKLLLAGILLLVAMVSSYLSSAIFMLTPWSDPLMEALLPMFSDAVDENTIMGIYDSIPLSSVVPMMVLFLICFAALMIPVYYRYRMAELWLMDHPDSRAFAALRASQKMMKRNAIAVFKLDLHFWWFFGLELLISLIGVSDLLLLQLGITLPIGETVSYFLFFFTYLVLQLALYLWKQNEVSVTYAHAYEALKVTAEEQPPRPNPWTSP